MNCYDPYKMEPDEAPMYHCPVCGEELNFDDDVYTHGGAVIGCKECICVKSAEYVL